MRGIHLVWCTNDFAGQLKCLCISGHVQFLHSNWKRETTKCKFSAWKVTTEEMECKFSCHERGKSSTVIANEHWTEAETKSGTKSLFGRNINILRGSKASVLSKSNFSAGLLSKLSQY